MANADVADAIIASLASRLQADIVLVGLSRAPQLSQSSSPSRIGPTRWLFPTGAYALGLWRPGDDVDLVLVTDNSRRIFFDHAAEALSIELSEAYNSSGYLQISDNIRCLPAERLRLLARAGSEVRLHYGSKLPNFESWAFGTSVVPNLADGVGVSKQFGIAGLQSIADVVHINKMVRQLGCSEEFADAYSRLHAWAKSYAIWGARYGFLDADCLLHMLCAAVGLAGPGLSADTMVRRFFTLFCGLELAEAIVRAEGKIEQRSGSSHRTAMVVLTRQGRNVASCIDTDGARLIQDAITRTALDPDDGMKRTLHDVYADFLEHHSYFVIVDVVDVRPPLRSFAARIREQLVHERAMQAVTLVHRRFREVSEGTEGLDIHVRVWPAPITFAHPLKGADNSTDPRRLTLLMGISHLDDCTDAGLVTIIKDITSLLPELENTISSENATSTKYTMLDVAIRMLERHDHDIQGIQQVRCQNSQCCPPTDPAPEREVSPPDSESAVNTRFRTAKQAMSRLRWDPDRDASEYEVGWIDRFDGMKWTALLDWGKATEEEDFIPEHRVWQIRRKEDEVVVWDRRTKRDDT